MRILVYRLGSLGDTVVALPCFRLIRQTHPGARITVLTNQPVSGKAAPLESILHNTGLVDDVIPYPIGLRAPGELARLRKKIAAQKFDLVISLTAARGLLASIRDYLFFRACGISEIIGIPWRRRDLVCLARDGVYESEADRLLRRVASLGEPGPNDLGLIAEERAEAQKLLGEADIRPPFLAASVGTKSPLKDWGADNWLALLTSLNSATASLPSGAGLALIFLGSADERDRCNDLARAWDGPTANFCGRTSPRVSAAILEQARLFLGHDSGPMHLAAVVGTPCVAIYSAQSLPGQWFPRGEAHINIYPHAHFDPQRMHDIPHQRAAIASISVASVLEAVKSCLSSRA